MPRRDAALVHLLPEADALPDDPENHGKTLSTAVEWGDLSIVETLIHAGAATNGPGGSENAPFTLAVKRQNHAWVKLRLGSWSRRQQQQTLKIVHGYHRYRFRSGALEAALRDEDISMAGYQLDRGADPLDTRASRKTRSPTHASRLRSSPSRLNNRDQRPPLRIYSSTSCSATRQSL